MMFNRCPNCNEMFNTYFRENKLICGNCKKVTRYKNNDD